MCWENEKLRIKLTHQTYALALASNLRIKLTHGY